MTSRAVLSSVMILALAACASPADESPAEMAPVEMAVEVSPPGPVAPPTDDAGKIASAMAAGPSAVSGAATIIDMGADMQMRTLREGTNGWTCMPDNPQSPGADPMCLDQNGVEWAMAWMEHRDPPAGKSGFGYMLMGGSDASNDDPFATGPAPDGTWVETGPHVMIFNVSDRFDGYPRTPDNPRAPYVMWPGTPYEHLMIPVE